MLKIIAFIQIALFCFSISATTQLNKGRSAIKSFYSEIPFEFIKDKIIIEAQVNGRKGRFIFDTGAPCIIFKDSSKMAYPKLQDLHVRDANNNRQLTEIVNLEQVQLGGVEFVNIPAIYSEPFPMPFSCFNVDGYIGSNVMRFGAFKVDWKRQVLIIADSYKDFNLTKKQGMKLLVSKVQSSPYISIKLNEKFTETLLIDTGSDDFYSLSNKHLKYFQSKGYLKDKVCYKSTGSSSHGMGGIDQSSQGSSIISINTLEIAGANFKNIAIRTTNSSSRIGTELLTKGDFVLDYRHKRFFFEPSDSDRSFQEKSFGVDLVVKNDTFRVGGVWQGTAADSLGIKVGDIVVDIDTFGLTSKPQCEAFFKLSDYTKDKISITLYYRKEEEKKIRHVRLNRITFD
ncbi:MAG: aspartyl protease family protein [Marinilabiliaceae bacterium]|nr:aspartyl protease family protein [Marinilabiliaceae bacterium]